MLKQSVQHAGGFWPEARSAVDTALALGKDDPESRRLRLRVYTGLIKPDPRESIWRTYKPVFGVLEAYTAPPKPGSPPKCFGRRVTT